MGKNNYFMNGWESIHPKENINIYNSNEDTDIHKHNFLEIVYFKSGIGTHFIDGESYEISNGNVCIINTSVEHYYHIKPNKQGKEIEVKNIIFFPEFFDNAYSADNFIDEIYPVLMHEPIDKHRKFLHVSNDCNKDLASLISIIEHELSLKRSGYLDTVRYCMYAILIKLFRENSTQQVFTPSLLRHVEVVEAALQIIDTEFMNKLTLNDLAMRFNYSSVHFNNIFKQYTGTTFNKYLQKARCEKAKLLLQNTDNTIVSICEDVGYLDFKQFFVIFKRIVGLTPVAYRKQYRQAHNVKP